MAVQTQALCHCICGENHELKSLSVNTGHASEVIRNASVD